MEWLVQDLRQPLPKIIQTKGTAKDQKAQRVRVAVHVRGKIM